MTEVLPTFAKITTILDFVNTSRSPDLSRPREKRKLAENINILKNCQHKFNRVLSMRYHQHPSTISIPFLDYYYDLVFRIRAPDIPTIFFNNTRSDAKAICTS